MFSAILGKSEKGRFVMSHGAKGEVDSLPHRSNSLILRGLAFVARLFMRIKTDF